MKRYYTRACNFYYGIESKTLVKEKKSLPLNDNNEILETQYFSVSGLINKNNETNISIESDITDRLQIVTQRLETTQLVIGFMLDNKKRDLLN